MTGHHPTALNRDSAEASGRCGCLNDNAFRLAKFAMLLLRNFPFRGPARRILADIQLPIDPRKSHNP